MSAVVRFRTGGGEYAVAVEHTREVRSASGIVPIPAPGPGVVGLLPWEDRSLTVVSSLGAGTAYVLVLDPGDHPFGLLVEDVTGVVGIDDDGVGPPPQGQKGDLVTGVVRTDDGLVLIIDAAAVARTAGS